MAEHCIAIYYQQDINVKYLMNLDRYNYFYRQKIGQIILATARELIDRTGDGSIINLSFEYGTVVGARTERGSCLIFMSSELKNIPDYLQTLAKCIIVYGMADTIPENFAYVKTQMKCDQIQNQLDDTKYIMVNNISLILRRGEKIEDLLIKSQHLEDNSRNFIIKTKKLNSCCIIL